MTRVMVVEDEGLASERLRETLERLGYEVPEVVRTGEEALRLVASLAPDLVLIDIKLRGPLDGIDTAARLRAWADVPVVFATSLADEASLGRAIATRPHGYLLKPFDARQLRAAVEVALFNHGAERELRVHKRLYDTALGSVDDGIVATDAEGRVLIMNGAAERLTGWQAEDAIGRDAWLVLRLVDSPPPRADGGPSRPQGQGMVLVARNGEERLVDEIASPVVDERGRPLGAVLVLCDVGGRPAIKSLGPPGPSAPPPALCLAPPAFSASALPAPPLAVAAGAALAPPPPPVPLVSPTLVSPAWPGATKPGRRLGRGANHAVGRAGRARARAGVGVSAREFVAGCKMVVCLFSGGTPGAKFLPCKKNTLAPNDHHRLHFLSPELGEKASAADGQARARGPFCVQALAVACRRLAPGMGFSSVDRERKLQYRM
ncbi:MAG TPA: response regulator [Polyangiaceae bacterium]|nr:response regulator [Polyangiaceae bacterium]